MQSSPLSNLKSVIKDQIKCHAAGNIEDIEDDLEGEKETIPDLDAATSISATSGWKDTMASASQGITKKTDLEYQRLINQCIKFLIDNKFIKKREDFVCDTPPEDAPLFITAWIMQHCDEWNVDGSVKPRDQIRDSYVYGQKMRAAMTHLFARIIGLGSSPWRRSEVTGKMCGNPSISEHVAAYMMSLRTRKIRNGEAPTSARAITSDIMKQLYDENHDDKNWILKEYLPGTRDTKNSDHWGGGMTRRALQAIYTIAFICLLCSDEVLKIRREHIVLQSNPHGIILTLPFRKTHQSGDVKPFYLRPLPEDEAHLCPVRALAEWIQASKVTSGYIFRKIASGDRVSTENSPMTSEQFLELFRNNLLDIGVDTIPYGTHSFRRGGCQYLASNRRWPLRRICEWGGWSTEFSNLTIVRYLISWNDNPLERREDYFDPDRLPAVKCFQCGRSCHCA